MLEGFPGKSPWNIAGRRTSLPVSGLGQAPVKKQVSIAAVMPGHRLSAAE